MISLKRVVTNLHFGKGSPHNVHTLENIAINPNSVVSLHPCNTSEIREIADKFESTLEYTKLTYTLGNKSETILVLGSYNEVLSALSSGVISKRRLLSD